MIKIITVGKVKSKHLVELIDYYKKQVPRKTTIIVNKDEPSISGIEKEGIDILNKIDENDFVITLEIKGENISSEELANKINEIETNFQKNITFVIGGSYGLSNSVSKRANYKLSFSKMTFPHQIMQLILIEQIFRAYSILNNHPYHK